jgi:hypothetical protein
VQAAPSPLASNYVTDPASNLLFNRDHNAQAVMTWCAIPHDSPFRNTCSFAVTFNILTVMPFSAIDFARLLFYFIHVYHPRMANTPPILHLCYVLHPDTVGSVLLCGKPLLHEYEDIQRQSLSVPEGSTVAGWLVTAWPPTSRCMLHPYRVMLAFCFARLVFTPIPPLP